MKKLYTLAFLLINMLMFSQTKALTEDGKDVLLLDNGTWRYVNITDSLALQTIKTNPTLFAKSKASTFQIKSKKLDIGLYLNTKIWRISTQTKSPFTEYVFNDVHDENAVGAFMMTEKVQIPTLKNLKDIILTGVQNKVDYFRLKESEYRTVNGLNVIYIRYIANIKGLDFEYAGYYYIDNYGYCGVVGFSTQQNFESNFPVILDLLNGLSPAKKQVVNEVIEYSSPPPPMK